MRYVELHSRSAFSFLEGGSLPEALVMTAAGLHLPAMALLDRNGFYGSPRFHMATKKCGLRAHVGAELSVSDGAGTTYHPLLCETLAGYQNLCRLITKTKLRVPKHTESFARFDELEEHANGLVCLTGDESGPLANALHTGGMDAGRELLTKLKATFGARNVYIELQRHFQREQETRNQAAIALARELNLPVLATNGVVYAIPSDREILDIFSCIRNKRQLATLGRLGCVNAERNIRTAGQMQQMFSDIPEAISNTVELSSRLQFSLEKLGYEFPRYPIPPGETMDSFLHARTWEGASNRYQPITDKVRLQLECELKLIKQLGLAGYFLIVWDIVRYCNQNGILVQGRGSAANSAVCYSLGITAVDPIGMDLLFERFLSEERGEWPDIDLDLPSGGQREKALQYVYERYGKLGAAMTANVITYRGRSAAREVGKALDFDDETLSRLAALVHTWEWKDPNDSSEPQFRDAGLDLQQPRIKKFFELYQLVQDLPRHLGQHSGGMVICQGQLDSIVPLEPAAMPGRVVVQWDKEDCADLGLIKVDLLGLGMLAVLEDSLKLIHDSYGEEVDLAHLPQNDPAVYQALQNADTVGMFQVESRAQMSCLPRLRPACFYDIVVQVAIIRPGPIVGNMVHPYLKRRQGREVVTYAHPCMEPILARTLGVPLFQEQLLRMAMDCAGFSGGEAEELRRAFGFKRSEARMKTIELKLRQGLARNGIHGKTQDDIVLSIGSFALYGFPESHAASFALIAYASAYLKCNYLAAFTAAILNNQPMGFYQPFTIVKDAQRHGLKVLPIDITCSDWLCTLEKDEDGSIVVRLGLRYVRGLSKQSGEAIVRERVAGEFAGIDDLRNRVPELRKDELRKLAAVGALNFIQNSSRRDALWQVERVTRAAGKLYEGVLEKDGNSPLLQMTLPERMDADFRGTGLTIGKHPVAYHRGELNKLKALRAIDIRRLRNGTFVRVAGWVIVRQRPGTAKGFMFLSLEDETGVSNIIVTPQLFEKYRHELVGHPFLLIEGALQNQDNVISVKASHVQALTFAVAATPSHDFH